MLDSSRKHRQPCLKTHAAEIFVRQHLRKEQEYLVRHRNGVFCERHVRDRRRIVGSRQDRHPSRICYLAACVKAEHTCIFPPFAFFPRVWRLEEEEDRTPSARQGSEILYREYVRREDTRNFAATSAGNRAYIFFKKCLRTLCGPQNI